MDMIQCNFDEHNRIWSGQERELFYDYDCSIGKVLHNSLRNYPKNVLQINDVDGRSVTNAETLLWSTRIAQHLKKMGLRHDDVIGIVGKNTTYLMPVAVGCFMNCTPFHAINPILDEKTVEYMFGLTKPKVIFCDGDVYDKVFKATKSLRPIIYTLTDHIDGVPKVEDLLLQPTHTERFYKPERLTQGGEQTVAILCSSGTTGMPKAVCISNHILLYDNLPFTSEHVAYTSSSLDWFTGLLFIVIGTLVGAKRVITNRPYSPEYFVELVQKYKLHYTSMAPRHVTALANCPTATAENLASLQMLGLSGGCVSKTTLNRLSKILPKRLFSFGYGLTEIGSVSFNFFMEFTSSVGKVTPGLRVRIVDDDGKNLAHNQTGEILVHTGREWNGYFGNPMETRRIQDSLGWYHTGDLGYFDENNFLYVVDRKKDIMKYQGFQYWPGEIEQMICELPEVSEACVVGVYDETVGDKAGALVVRKKGCNLSEQQVIEHVRQRLPASYKQLHAGVRFIEKLPHNDNGKTIRREAKELFEALIK